MSEPAKSLSEAMARVWSRVKYVRKDKRMQGGGSYTYVSDAALIDALRPELVAEGVTFAPVAMEPLAVEVFENKNGNRQNRVLLKVTYRFTHAASKDTLDVVTCGEGMDVGDKATNKAMTAAAKYALRQTFCVETGDDPDDTPSHEQERKPQAAPAPQQAAPNADLCRYFLDRFGKVKSRDEVNNLEISVAEAVKAKRLTEPQVNTIRLAAEGARKSFPVPAKT